MSEVRVLHVLPHAGAGAQTYIDVLSELPGFSFDLLELSGSRAPLGAGASIAARLPRIAAAARRADLVHVHGEVAALACLPVLAARRSLVTLHGLHLLRRLPPGIPRRLGRLGLARIVATADRTICVSQAERDELDWLTPRLRSRLVVVRNGLRPEPATTDEERERARAELGLANGTVAVLYAGQLEPRKDPLTAARAALHAHAGDPRIVLLVAGTGPCEAELRATTGEAVRLLGQRRDVPLLLAAADVFVMPSLREGLSYAVLEALARGVATVVSDGTGNPEAVGDAGLVFPAGDDRALAALLLELASSPARRERLGAAGRDRIATTLSAERMLDGTRAAYLDALRGPGRAPGGAPV